MPGFVRAGRPRSRGAFSHDVVTPTSQYCRSIRAPLVIEGTPSVFVVCLYFQNENGWLFLL